MSQHPKVIAAGERIAPLLDEIMESFVGGKLTLLVRQPGQPEQDFVMTSDSLEEAIAALERRRAKEVSNACEYGTRPAPIAR